MEEIIESNNILGQELKSCCKKPMTGFCRDGFCRTGNTDHSVHVVCAIITKKFLRFTKSCGNDLSTPNSSYGFPGLSQVINGVYVLQDGKKLGKIVYLR